MIKNFNYIIGSTDIAITLDVLFITAKATDIVDTAVSAGQFKTLVAAVTAAGLVSILKGKGPFTVFASTAAVFAKLPAGTVESLLKPKNKSKLVAILTYHGLPRKSDGRGHRRQEAQRRDGPGRNGQCKRHVQRHDQRRERGQCRYRHI